MIDETSWDDRDFVALCIKPAADDFRLVFSKLLEILSAEWCNPGNDSNLLDCKQSSGKNSIVCSGFNTRLTYESRKISWLTSTDSKSRGFGDHAMISITNYS
ncbi:PREDICTED: uncharacterized protein LOC105563148 [Vollenhovia emeryi]|uniref:uncharacterized protein LOC105563148 n=1 Tax=Vollenhovia emeryi TaxID=411798 RepID=UPI0005F54CBC|nr:PREDICTED: uncharacterized protein LOC105563148 [Vollenhovia emeryi]